MPMGPVENVFATLEAAGILVVRRSLGSSKISAITARSSDGPPLMVFNEGMPADRERFAAMHELGHLIMHEVPRENAEREADMFASEMLMPAAEIRPMLTGIDLAKAATLKRYWRTSMASIFRAARDLSCIPEPRYRSICSMMSQRGYHRNEPVELAHEEPTVIPAILQVHQQRHGYTVEELATVARLNVDEFRTRFGRDAGSVRRLRVVR
jgi:Zn-dependent peptidase ImmA (M78 family)